MTFGTAGEAPLRWYVAERQVGQHVRVIDRRLAERKIARLRPCVLCFNGKRAASEFLRRRQVGFGLQSEPIGSTQIFIAPSTSGAANGSWEPSRWDELAELVRSLPRGRGAR